MEHIQLFHLKWLLLIHDQQRVLNNTIKEEIVVSICGNGEQSFLWISLESQNTMRKDQRMSVVIISDHIVRLLHKIEQINGRTEHLERSVHRLIPGVLSKTHVFPHGPENAFSEEFISILYQTNVLVSRDKYEGQQYRTVAKVPFCKMLQNLASK